MLRKDAFTINPTNHLSKIAILDNSNPILHFDSVHEGDRGTGPFKVMSLQFLSHSHDQVRSSSILTAP